MKKYSEKDCVQIWTDGSAIIKSPQYGGFGVYILDEGKEKTISKGYIHTKTGRMETMGLLNAIRYIEPQRKVVVQWYCDSQYVVNTLKQGWLYNWRANKYIGHKNSDLWEQVYQELEKRPLMKLECNWIRGHQKDLTNPIIFGNNCADALADYKRFDKYIEDNFGYLK